MSQKAPESEPAPAFLIVIPAELYDKLIATSELYGGVSAGKRWDDYDSAPGCLIGLCQDLGLVSGRPEEHLWIADSTPWPPHPYRELDTLFGVPGFGLWQLFDKTVARMKIEMSEPLPKRLPLRDVFERMDVVRKEEP